jgi:hypothetical protein
MPQTPVETLQQKVEDELRLFDVFFQGLGNQPLSHAEAAILRTYLIARWTERLSPPETS